MENGGIRFSFFFFWVGLLRVRIRPSIEYGDTAAVEAIYSRVSYIKWLVLGGMEILQARSLFFFWFFISF